MTLFGGLRREKREGRLATGWPGRPDAAREGTGRLLHVLNGARESNQINTKVLVSRFTESRNDYERRQIFSQAVMLISPVFGENNTAAECF